MDEEEIKAAQVRLRANGDLIKRIDGTEIVIAHYEKTTGVLEYADKECSVKWHNQVIAKLGSVNQGTQPSSNVIRSITVKGAEAIKPTGSKKPKMGPEGDGTPVLVDWYIRNALPEAIIRYGIYTDAAGKPIRKNVQRAIEVWSDNRDGAEDPVPTPVKGQSYEGGPIKRKKEIINVRNAIIARRATRYEDNPDVLADLGVEKLEALFTPQEVVGGFQPDEDFEPQRVGAGEAEVDS